MPRIVLSALFVVAATAVIDRSAAQITETKLIPTDGAGGDSFGCFVSLSGDYALVGAYEDVPAGAPRTSIIMTGTPGQKRPD